MNLFGLAVIFWLSSALEEIGGEKRILLLKPKTNSQSIWVWTYSGNKNSDPFITGWSHPVPGDQKYSVCDVTAKITPINWLRTDFIDIKDAKLLEITVYYSLRCPKTDKKCVTSFGLFVYHADVKQDPEPDPTKVPFKEVAKMQSTSTPGLASVDYVSDATVVTKKAGVYLAFLDSGACFFITKVIVSYKYCPPTGGVLVKFQETVAPANNSQLVKQYGECTDSNSVNQTELSAVCLSSGEWNANSDISCLCRAGYELVNGSGDAYKCEECPADLYKDVVNNSKCQPCPANSSPNPDRTTCKCDAQFYREDLAAIRECKALPAAPQKSNKTALVEGTSVTIWWSKSPSGQGQIRYSLDCFKCKSKKDKNCEDLCTGRISYWPRKVNITGIEARVSGLTPYSYFMFRVYAVNELNQLEKDRDKWNYVQVFVATGEGRDKPTGSGTGGTGMSRALRMALYIAVPIGVVLIFLIIIFGIFFCRGRSKRGYGQPVEMKDGSVVLPTTGQRLYIDPSNYEDPEEALRNFAKELDKKQITLEKVIGGGEFGEVYKGELTRPDEEPIPVAIKTLKATSLKKDRDDFLAEASIMGQFCDPNVIYLEGVITKTLPLMIVTEFMANGSLDHYLKDMDGKLSVLQLLGMARGVASGMKYLSDMNFVHRDLAARNVLVSEGMVCKVADFGLSREVEDSAYETKGGKIPVRWTSPEAIDFRKFSWASDVWSYGILLWEIMSFGERPYWQWSNFMVIERVKGGYRLPIPVGNQEKCPKSIHNIMLNCWDADRNKRPTFAAIVKKLDYLIRSPDRLNEDPATTNSFAKLECTETTPIKDWLQSIKMGMYSDKFQKCGYRQLGDLSKQDDLDLNEIGVKLIGHKNKIRKSFREMKKVLQEEPSVTSLPV